MTKTKVVMTFEDEVLEFVQLRATLENRSIGNILLTALNLYNWYTDVKDAGGEVYSKDAQGNYYRVKTLNR